MNVLRIVVHVAAMVGLAVLLIPGCSRTPEPAQPGNGIEVHLEPARPDKLVIGVHKGDWPQFRGNPRQTGVATTTLPARLAIRWKFEAKDSVGAAPAIIGNTTYVGSLDGKLYALDLKTGKPRWQFKASSFKAAVSVRNGKVFAGDVEGLLHCLDARTGKELWSYQADAEISSGVNFVGPAILFGCEDEHLYGISQEGKLLWKFNVAGDGPVLGSPAVLEGRTFAAGCDAMLHVIDIKTGKEISALDLGGQVGASAAVEGEHIFVATMSNEVLAINWKQNKIEWRFEPEREQPFFASPALSPRLVIAGNRDKAVYALDRLTGKEVWNYPTRGVVDSSPVIAGKRVVFGSADQHVYVLNLETGALVQRIPLDAPIIASPAVGARCIVIGTVKGTIYCLGAAK